MIKLGSTDFGSSISGYGVFLSPLTQQDLDLVLSWRNSENVRCNMDSSHCISKEEHYAWFDSIKHSAYQKHWMVYFKDTPIGVTNIRSCIGDKTIDSAANLEPGLYIGEQKYQNNIIAFAPTLAMYDFCFEYLATVQFQARVKKSNNAALNYNKKLGYEFSRRGDLCELLLNRKRYEDSTVLIKQFLSRESRKENNNE